MSAGRHPARRTGVPHGLQRAWAVGLDLALPRGCVGCGASLRPDGGAVPLCDGCWQLLQAELLPVECRCATCGKQLISELESCTACRERSYAFASHRSLWAYRGLARELLQAFKFDRHTGLAPVFAATLAARVDTSAGAATWLVPVPPRPARLRAYGYDPVHLVARAVRRRHHLPVLDALERSGGRQQKVLDFAGRRRNIVGRLRALDRVVRLAHRAAGERQLHAIVIDDVFTTGATVDECARILQGAGFATVHALTMAQD